jgi:hypothetical protein
MLQSTVTHLKLRFGSSAGAYGCQVRARRIWVQYPFGGGRSPNLRTAKPIGKVFLCRSLKKGCSPGRLYRVALCRTEDSVCRQGRHLRREMLSALPSIPYYGPPQSLGEPGKKPQHVTYEAGDGRTRCNVQIHMVGILSISYAVKG